MGGPSYENPVLLTMENEELYRAFEDMINQLQRRDDQAARVVSMPIEVFLVKTTDLILLPRVGKDGFALGRVSYCFASDLSQGDGTDNWTFKLYRHFNDSGTRNSAPIVGGSWSTTEHGLRAYLPKVMEFDRPLNPGDTLRCEITKNGSPAQSNVFGSVQVEEMYGPEE